MGRAPVRRTSFPDKVAACDSALRFFHLGDARVEVMLPSTREDAWPEYCRRLTETGAFAGRVFQARPASVVLGELARCQVTLVAPSKNRPRIGIPISAPHKLLPAGDWFIEQVIARVIEQGGQPVLVPPLADEMLRDTDLDRDATIQAMLSGLDGMVGPGGDDVHPEIYGGEAFESDQTCLARDRFEGDLQWAATRAQLSYLGICRSHQLVNARDGTGLVQDIEREGLSSGSRFQSDWMSRDVAYNVPCRRSDGFAHVVQPDTGSMLAAVLGPEPAVTNAFYHQAVLPRRASPPRGRERQLMRPVAWTPDTVGSKETRTVAATERRPAAMTVQYHPEFPGHVGTRVFDASIRRAAIYHLLRGLRASGPPDQPVPIGTLLAAMRSSDATGETSFDVSDYRWVQTDLAADWNRGRYSVTVVAKELSLTLGRRNPRY